jgi:hypothetical protein
VADPNADIDRLAAAIERAITEGREPRDDWRISVSDALTDLFEAVGHGDEGRAADAAMSVRLAIDCLAEIWFDQGEKDRIHLGKEGL